MAKAVKKARKSTSTRARVMKAVASLLPRKKTTKKAKANSKSKRATTKSSRITKVTKKAKTKAKSLASKARRATSRKQSKLDTKRAASPSYAETLKNLVQEKQRMAKPGNDPAHAPGHRKIRIAGLKKTRSKDKSPDDSTMTANSKADRIHQQESEQRRLIPGASIERKGRRG